MKVEQQVTSLEISKKLKELGVKQGSLWYWENSYRKVEYGRINPIADDNSHWRVVVYKTYGENYSAFSVAELGETLPEDTRSYKYQHIWFCKSPTTDGWQQTDADTEANARGKMRIYLIEKGLVKIDG